VVEAGAPPANEDRPAPRLLPAGRLALPRR
jgi:hypothetical protein